MKDIEKLLEGDLPALSERLEHALHSRGLYTSADVENSPEPGRLIRAALAEAFRPMEAHILELIRQEE